MVRKRLILGGAIGAVVLVLVVGVAWLVLHTTIRLWFWDKVASFPLGEDDKAELATCESAGFWTLLRAANEGIAVPCGEAWFASELAGKLKSSDRARWFELRVADPAAPASLRLRGAVALALAGRHPPEEPMWLLKNLPPDLEAEWLRASVESDPVAVQLGPAVRTLGIAARVRQDLAPGAASVPALEWLAWVDDPAAESAATSTATQVAGVYPELVEQVRGRLAAGRPVGGAAARWRPLVARHPECGTRCGPLFTAILEQTLTDQAIEDGTPLPPELPEPPHLAQILTALGAPSQERRAVAYGWSALSEWIGAAPDRAERLRSFARRPTKSIPSIARVPWDGVAPPFLAALVISALGEEASVPVDVRVDDSGGVWLNIDGVDIPRSCSAPGAPPEGTPWPDDAVLAGALTERAASETDHTRGLRLATAAERIDPLIGGPLAVRLASNAAPELEVGRRIGVGLLAPVSPPVGADTARRRMGERGPALCE